MWSAFDLAWVSLELVILKESVTMRNFLGLAKHINMRPLATTNPAFHHLLLCNFVENVRVLSICFQDCTTDVFLVTRNRYCVWSSVLHWYLWVSCLPNPNLLFERRCMASPAAYFDTSACFFDTTLLSRSKKNSKSNRVWFWEIIFSDFCWIMCLHRHILDWSFAMVCVSIVLRFIGTPFDHKTWAKWCLLGFLFY